MADRTSLRYHLKDLDKNQHLGRAEVESEWCGN
jgi:hypothetical protein